MKKKKLSGWAVIGLCLAAMVGAVAVIFAIGQLG